jgi:hypothetical protein
MILADAIGIIRRSFPFDPATLQQRYDLEPRWQLRRPERENLTMELWTEMLSE